MNEITYHLAGTSDIQALVDLRIEFLEELMGQQDDDVKSRLMQELEAYFNKAIPGNEYIAFIARYGDEVAGAGGMVIRMQPGNFKNPTGKVAYLMSMYTKPAFRKRGICTQLLNALMDDAAETGITSFELHATKDGEGVYLKSGFHIHPEPTMRKHISV